MKKMLLAILLLVITSAGAYVKEVGFKDGEASPSQHKQDAGYKGLKDTEQTHINQIRDFRQGGYVTLEGYIMKKGHGNNYQFRDNTGSISIEVPEKIFNGKTYTAKDKVRVSGKVHDKGNKTKLHVTQINEP